MGKNSFGQAVLESSKKASRRNTITFSLPLDVTERLKKICKKEGLKRSSVVEHLLIKFMSGVDRNTRILKTIDKAINK